MKVGTVFPRKKGEPRGGRAAESRGRRAPTPSGRAWNVPERSVVLAGHRQLLAAVHRTLLGGERALLYNVEGRAGTGATTAINEFAHRHVRDYDIVWWIRAADPELVPDEMAALAEALGLADTADDGETATARLLDALQHRRRYLLVFDNAETPRQLARFLPAGGGHVVITSPDPHWRAFATAHPVEPFSRSESVALLRARRPDLPVAAAASVAAALEDLPLAVDPAAALLADTGMSAERLRRLLSDRTVDHPARCGSQPDPVETMWEVALDCLAADDPAALALLTLVAWLGPEPVPLGLISEHAHELSGALGGTARNPVALTTRMTALQRRGLARTTRDSVALHRVPAALLVARTAGEHLGGDERGWAAIAVRLLRAAVPGDPGRDPTCSVTAWRPLLPLVLAATDPTRRLDEVAADAGQLLHDAAAYLRMRGQPRAAAALSRDADDLARAGGRPSSEPLRVEPAARVRSERVMPPCLMKT